MKLSHVLTIVIAAAVIFGVYSYYSKKQTVKAITYVLEQDRHAGQGASTVAELVRRQGTISLLNCPSDFTIAYRRHQAAWQDMKSVEEEAISFKKRYDSGAAYIEAFLRGLVFDLSMIDESAEAYTRVNNHLQTAKKSVEDTFHEVLNIAESYGVDTTTYR